MNVTIETGFKTFHIANHESRYYVCSIYESPGVHSTLLTHLQRNTSAGHLGELERKRNTFGEENQNLNFSSNKNLQRCHLGAIEVQKLPCRSRGKQAHQLVYLFKVGIWMCEPLCSWQFLDEKQSPGAGGTYQG